MIIIARGETNPTGEHVCPPVAHGGMRDVYHTTTRNMWYVWRVVDHATRE